jgi:hypothetical protein
VHVVCVLPVHVVLQPPVQVQPAKAVQADCDAPAAAVVQFDVQLPVHWH